MFLASSPCLRIAALPSLPYSECPEKSKPGVKFLTGMSFCGRLLWALAASPAGRREILQKPFDRKMGGAYTAAPLTAAPLVGGSVGYDLDRRLDLPF
jgi:hypothetical protein